MDLVLWMRYEVKKMRELAHDLRCPLYVIPRLQVSALVDLITTDKENGISQLSHESGECGDY